MLTPRPTHLRKTSNNPLNPPHNNPNNVLSLLSNNNNSNSSNPRNLNRNPVVPPLQLQPPQPPTVAVSTLPPPLYRASNARSVISESRTEAVVEMRMEEEGGVVDSRRSRLGILGFLRPISIFRVRTRGSIRLRWRVG